jgi:hypothetical protein
VSVVSEVVIVELEESTLDELEPVTESEVPEEVSTEVAEPTEVLVSGSLTFVDESPHATSA